MKKYIKLMFFAVVILTPFSASAEDSAVTTKISSGLFYSSGQSQTTGSADSTLYSIPLMLSFRGQRVHAGFSTSYMDITSRYPTTGTSSKVSGMGDLTFSLGYDLTDQPSWTVTVKHKFATGDKSKGLSTGKDDNYLQLDYFSAIGQRSSFFATAGYKFVGKVQGAGMKDSAYGSVGAGYFFPSKTSVGLSLDYLQSSYTSLKDQTGVSVFVGKSLSKLWSISAFGSYDNTSTQSMGLTFTRKF